MRFFKFLLKNIDKLLAGLAQQAIAFLEQSPPRFLNKLYVSFIKIRFKSKKAIVPQIITTADNNAVINKFSLQLATANDVYFARHFSSLETFLLLKLYPPHFCKGNKLSYLFQKNPVTGTKTTGFEKAK
jgi:hypothetical protein